jgi:hypothetical protein
VAEDRLPQNNMISRDPPVQKECHEMKQLFRCSVDTGHRTCPDAHKFGKLLSTSVNHDLFLSENKRLQKRVSRKIVRNKDEAF